MQRTSLKMKSSVLIVLLGLNICTDYFNHANAQITCDSACQRGIDDAYNHASSIHSELTKVDDNIIKEINRLGNDEVGILSEINSLKTRMKKAEDSLKASDTNALRKYIDDEVIQVWRELNSMDTRYDNQIRNLTRIVNGGSNGNGNGNGNVADLTRRMDKLEYNTVYNLTVDNQMWRANFRNINATFVQLQKRSPSFNCPNMGDDVVHGEAKLICGGGLQ